VEMPAQKLKGISAAVTVFEVPWHLPDTPSSDEESPTPRSVGILPA